MADLYKVEGSFIEIICVNNGYAVYDFSIRHHALYDDRKAIPMLVFNSKKDLIDWLYNEWDSKPVKEI